MSVIERSGNKGLGPLHSRLFINNSLIQRKKETFKRPRNRDSSSRTQSCCVTDSHRVGTSWTHRTSNDTWVYFESETDTVLLITSIIVEGICTQHF